MGKTKNRFAKLDVLTTRMGYFMLKTSTLEFIVTITNKQLSQLQGAWRYQAWVQNTAAQLEISFREYLRDVIVKEVQAQGY